jgi:hypothetical protein
MGKKSRRISEMEEVKGLLWKLPKVKQLIWANSAPILASALVVV